MKRIAIETWRRAASQNAAPSAKNCFASRLVCCALALAAAEPAMARIQIIGLTDRQVTSTPGQGLRARSVAGASAAKTSDSFCIVSAAPGGAVSLAFTSGSGNAGDGQSWQARNSAGVSMNYLQTVSNVDGTGEVQVSRSGTNVFVVSATRAVASSAACGSGNVTKSVTPTTTIPTSGGPYTDVVTLVATPM